MKKKIQRCLVITLILLCGITLGFSTAFISRSISAHNVITFGKVKMQVHETYLDPNGNELPFEQERVTKLTSDTMQNRLFRIENTGKHPLYVRLSFLVVGTDRDGMKFDAKNYFCVNTQLKEWIYQDGWYYYDSILESGEQTEALVTNVICDLEELLRCYPGSEFKLSVLAQAVQSENNYVESVVLAEGWPKM